MRDVSAGSRWHRWGAGWEVSGQWGVPRTSKSWRLMWSCRQRRDAGFSESWVSWSSGIYNGLTWQEQQQPYELWETLLGSEKEEDKPSMWASASPTHGAWEGWGLTLAGAIQKLECLGTPPVTQGWTTLKHWTTLLATTLGSSDEFASAQLEKYYRTTLWSARYLRSGRHAMEDPREKCRAWILHFCSWNRTVLCNIHMCVPFPGEFY